MIQDKGIPIQPKRFYLGILLCAFLTLIGRVAFSTVTSTVNSVTYVGNGAVTAYNYNFRIFAPADLQVNTINAASQFQQTLILNTDYTVTGAGLYPGGSVSLIAGPLGSGVTLTLQRIEPLTQLTSFRNQGKFYPAIHEDAFDKLTMMVQQMGTSINTLQLELTPVPTVAGFSGTITNVNGGMSVVGGWVQGIGPTLTPTLTPTPTPTAMALNNYVISYPNNTPSPTPSIAYLKTNCPVTLTAGTWIVSANNFVSFSSGSSSVTISSVGAQWSASDGANTGTAPGLATGAKPSAGLDQFFISNGAVLTSGSGVTQTIHGASRSFIFALSAPETIYFVPSLIPMTPLSEILVSTAINAIQISNATQ